MGGEVDRKLGEGKYGEWRVRENEVEEVGELTGN